MNITLPPGGILLGLGCDLIEVERIRGVIERHGERFLQRIFTAEERDYCFSVKYPHKHLAARWAAKEAVSKAFTTGVGPYLDWTSVSVYHGERQQPLVRLDAKGEALLRQVGATQVCLSLSHIDAYAMAVAALVGQPPA
jgi:holo-[acyl-carrier protein] synthase